MSSARLRFALGMSLIGLIAGCGKGLSSSDEAFVSSTMPPGFSAFHMSGNRVSSSDIRQTCSASIHGSGEAYGKFTRESVQLEEGVGAGYTFDINADLGPGGWRISTDGQPPTPANYVVFRSLVIDCIAALRREYQADSGGGSLQPISIQR